MKLYKFDNIDKLNTFIQSAKGIKKVKLLTEGSGFKLKTFFYVLIDKSNNYQNK